MPHTKRAASNGAAHRYGGAASGRPGGRVSYGPVPPEVLLRAVTAVTNAGDAITLGRTSEGGAYYVGVLADGLLEKFYLDSLEALQECLEGIADAGEALVE